MSDAGVAQKVERILGKDEVTSSNLVISSIQKDFPHGKSFCIYALTDSTNSRYQNQLPTPHPFSKIPIDFFTIIL